MFKNILISKTRLMKDLYVLFVIIRLYLVVINYEMHDYFQLESIEVSA